VFYFNTEPRLKWNKISLAAKIILFYFSSGSMLKWNTKIKKKYITMEPRLYVCAVVQKLIRMNMPVAQDGSVHFSTTLLALIRESLYIRMGPGWCLVTFL